MLWFVGTVCTVTGIALWGLPVVGEERVRSWQNALTNWSSRISKLFGDVVSSAILPHRSRLKNLIAERLSAGPSPEERRILSMTRLMLWGTLPFLMISGASLWFFIWVVNWLADKGEFLPLLILSAYLFLIPVLICGWLAGRIAKSNKPILAVPGLILAITALLLMLPIFAVSFPAIFIFAAYVALWVISSVASWFTQWTERKRMKTVFEICGVALSIVGALLLSFAAVR